MIKRGRKRNILVTICILVILCAAGAAAFTDAMEPKRENAEEGQLSSGRVGEEQLASKPDRKESAKKEQAEQAKALTAKEAEYDITDSWGADPPYIYYEDDTKMIFSGYFGLFVYSKEKEEIVQSLDLKEIGCNMTQGDDYCEINVSEDGKTVYLHIMKDEKMYQYSVNTKELQYVDYNLPQNLFDRKRWEKKHQSGIKLNGATIGDLVYYYEDEGGIKYQPLFNRPYGSCDFFETEDIRDLKEVSFYTNGTEHVITDAKKLQWIEEHFSKPLGEYKNGSGCPYGHVMYLKRKDGTCGKIFPATDSCSMYQTGKSYFEYGKGVNDVFWKMFGINVEELH